MIGFKAMTHVSPRAFSGIAVFPRSLSSLAVSVAALALFLVFGSWILLCGPMGSTFQGYLVGIDRFRRVQSTFYTNQTENQFQPQTPIEIAPKENEHSSSFSAGDSVETTKDSNLRMQSNQTQSDLLSDGKPESSSNQNQSDFLADGKLESGSNQNQSDYLADGKPESGSDFANETSMPLSPDLSNSSKNADSGDCDLYHGKWFYDPAGPLYTNNTCPVLTQMQNCQGNGRPDKEYENWRWKPSQCDLPRFDGKKFLELMRGKTLAFVGDSVARNQMESLLCLLWQVETPKNRGNRQMQRWYFRSNSVMIVRIWSSWLVHHSSEAFKFSPDGIAKLRLNLPDDAFFKHLPSFDVLVLSSGHWFAKQSVYILDEEIVGGQLWWPASGHKKKINNVEAFGISVEKALSAVVNHPNYTGLTIVRSYSPDHYEGGAWNTGGSCTGKVQPLSVNEMVENGFTQRMYENQVTGFERALKQMRNGSKLKLMDITGVFGMRPDGHPGPYRNLDPNKVTKRGPNGQPPPQDCLHWCMPGPVDTWNELLLEIIKRDFEGG